MRRACRPLIHTHSHTYSHTRLVLEGNRASASRPSFKWHSKHFKRTTLKGSELEDGEQDEVQDEAGAAAAGAGTGAGTVNTTAIAI